ncbi:MAG: alkaline phosphatase D family protein [Planctomycetes bacterium]|nr:alkaline phosphatase D family protein [Planctomycetota bacterium]
MLAGMSSPILTRRELLRGGAVLLGLPFVPSFGPRHRPRPARFRADPFALGVASGDPRHDGVVLWTRLCPQPLAPDGGMAAEAVEVGWELATDDGMRQVVAKGTVAALPELAHAVHVELDGLAPERHYWYRFRAGDAVSPIGRTRTFPVPAAMPARLRFAFASCQHWEQGLYTAYADMARQDPDFVVHLGDYIYEYAGTDGLVRKHIGGKLTELADYRLRHAQYRSDPLLHGMHAQCPWFVTWDDHEVENNYADAASERAGVSPEAFLRQRAAAYRAYYEAMPLRRASLPQGPAMRLYRQASFGRLAELFVLDTRQYRTDQPNGDGRRPLNAAARDPRNTLLGSEQKRWLWERLAASPATWNVLAQQVIMGLLSYPPPKAKAGEPEDPARRYSMDQWPGYAHERAELLRFLAERKIANPIVLTGDVHANFVLDLRVDDAVASEPIVATEFVGTSISSGGDGSDAAKELAALQPHNPGLRHLDRHRGYVLCEVDAQEWRSDYRIVDVVTRPGGTTTCAASFTVRAGRPGVVA